MHLNLRDLLRFSRAVSHELRPWLLVRLCDATIACDCVM
jgi:hypothetical protein